MKGSWGIAAALATALIACRGEPESVDRVRLLQLQPDGVTTSLPLAGHEAAGDTRPALRLGALQPLRLLAPAAGRLRLAATRAAATDPPTRLRLARETPSGSETLAELTPDESWRPVPGPTQLSAGETLTLSVEGASPVWVAGGFVEREGPPKRAPLVVVVLIDTVRADHTSLDGYEHETTPTLEALAEDGATFTRAYSTSSWTRPSTASLLTSLEPHRHHAVDRFDRIAPDVVTWPEVARAEGYQTVAISTNPNVLASWGFDRGFERFIDLDSAGWDERDSDATAVFGQALAIIDSDALPLFLYLHVLDPHSPYQPPVESARAIYPDFRADEPGERAAPSLLAWAVRRYDGEIRHADMALGRFLAELRKRRIYESAAFVVVGDHGEEFGDHGGVSHGKTLYEEQLRVPLVIKLPGVGGRGARVSQLVSILDALPTLAEALGWSSGPANHGHSLLPAMRGGVGPREQVTAALHMDGVEAYALVGPREKLIRTVAPEPTTLLFDLSRDPGERQPIEDPERVGAMASALAAHIAASQSGWHLRLCGGAAAQPVAFAVEPIRGDVTQRGIDPDDRVTLVDGQLDVRALVGPATHLRELAGKQFEIVEEDELVFQSDRPRLRLTAPAGDLALFVGGERRSWQPLIALDPNSAGRGASDPPVCRADSPASLYVWHVAPPDAAPAPEIEPELRERLMELGYLQDDASGGGLSETPGVHLGTTGRAPPAAPAR